jgi:hypothetical protein
VFNRIQIHPEGGKDGNAMKAVSILPGITIAASLLAAAGCGAEADANVESEQQSGSTAAVTEEALDLTMDDVHLTMETDGTSLTVGISAPTTGWVAVGFDPSAAMKDANIVIGYVADGQVYLRDDWGSGHTSHEPDTDMGGADDITDASGEEAGGVTSISFTIPLDSGTPGDKAMIPGTTYDILLAYGPDDADNFQGYHRWAEVIEVEF